jgi:hypothetical protein
VRGWLDVVRHAVETVAVLRGDGFALYAAVPGAAATVEDLGFAHPRRS